MKIKPFKKEYLETIRLNWNNDMPTQFLLRYDLIQSQLFDSNDIAYDASFIALHKNQIVGAVITKTWDHDGIPGYRDYGWISLIHVSKPFRRQGIGTTLLQQSIAALQDQGKTVINIGKDMNNLFCGVPRSFEEEPFFHKNDFTTLPSSFDMHRKITTSDTLTLRQQTEYDIRLATREDFPRIHDFFERCFPGRWQQEFIEYVNDGGNGKEFVIIIKDNKVIAFCRINEAGVSPNMYNTNFHSNFTRLFGIGPLGVDSTYRGLSLGYDVTAYAVNLAIELGASDIIIDWTSLVSFYQKLGFDVWSEYQTFQWKQ